MKQNSSTRHQPLKLVAMFVITWFITSAMIGALSLVDTTPPKLDIWYGEHQVFGVTGLPQKWVNVLGNVSDEESYVSSLTYQLNGAPAVTLRLGPDLRRLLKPGDFNIELDATSLKQGENTLALEATNTTGLKTTRTVTVDLSAPKNWPLPFSIDWSKVTNANDVLQITDGKWSWDRSGIRPVEVGYDRVLAIGDPSWTDYEVNAALMVHGILPGAYNLPESAGAGFGVNLRWLGFTDMPVRCNWPAQPHCGWVPTGASNWYSFKQSGADITAIEADPPPGSTSTSNRKLQVGHRYIFKQRVETAPQGHLYRLRIWEPEVESEPAGWLLERLTVPGDDSTGNLRHGSFLLVAHNVDVTFGNLTVVPLAYLLDVQVTGQGTVTRSPEKFRYVPGEVVTLTATPGPGWVFGGWEGDMLSSQNPLSLPMDTNRSIRAVFHPAGQGYTFLPMLTR